MPRNQVRIGISVVQARALVAKWLRYRATDIEPFGEMTEGERVEYVVQQIVKQYLEVKHDD